jgi:hypothetical protein
MTARQVGGMQEVFLELRWATVKGVELAVRAVEKVGGRVLHAYVPSIMVASVPSDQVDRLVGKSGILSATPEPLAADAVRAADRESSFAMTAWNEHFDLGRRMYAMTSPELRKGWDAAERHPPDPPEEIMQELRRRDMEFAPARAAVQPTDKAPNMSIPVLVGRIAVGLVWVDSTVAQFQITDQEKGKVLSETIEGLNMLSSFEPGAGIQWFYDFKRPKISLTANQFTAANQNSHEDLWRNAAMQAMGYSASLSGMNDYINDIKASNNADWAYAIFVTKYPSFWFAYYWGNHVVMDFAVDGWGIDNFSRVVAHETGHVFGCPDEYSSSNCSCTALAGRYRIPNGNCELCASPFVQCLMAHNTEAVCDYTRGHLGWNEVAVQSRGTTTLKGTWTFDFETGVQGPPTGADIWWEQVDNVTRFLVPRSGAMLAHMGKPTFDAVSRQTLQGLAYTSTPINGSNNASNQLTAGTVIAIKTSSGRYAKMKINSYGYNLGITWVTYK